MTLDKQPETIHTMFNIIAQKYDFINNIMSFGTQIHIKSACIKNLELKSNDRVLDLCCGTGDLAGLIKKTFPDINVTGIDFSEKMLDIAKNKYPQVRFFQGDATNLPYEDNYFDVVTMGFGLRNIQNAEKAVEEVYRILKPNGKFLHLDFGEKNLLSKIYDKITPIIVSRFTENASAYSYLIKSRQIFPTPADLIKDFESKGFKPYKRKDYIFGVISSQIMLKL
jgi:demethylmenaquinone methyltransferase/2-methoxy-6-polyprenyl-1,4-benzoquinol methylase